ncbi:MAG: hypothetical protein APG12_01479 [Candidatus Methanofastidiosum methylothiophilum]|uniref:Uncharacterized protein n=1 Tax=Candidatus Methanofastidiosum methylothiophilum TaxID=1705564 RepID=A0A150IX29_9EURY|nr:MAG: hypothetical protein APG10_01229 [Candidatus Methanofastidiosum methylthiophilus]KYC47037.1 MAG: hypothetical protein APG11_01477 [Candidatus Methanofastidiosum methylthiophilus]KYC49458.1 MAG: hypothetical protein APG12_01479 [Candidatus Methanofastidiosum methylthiophilus]
MAELSSVSLVIGAMVILMGIYIILSLLRIKIKEDKDALVPERVEFTKKMMLWLAVGISLGLLYGQVIFNNFALGMPAGIGIGLSMSVSFGGLGKPKTMGQLKLIKNLLISSMIFLIIGIGMFLILLR